MEFFKKKLKKEKSGNTGVWVRNFEWLTVS